MRLIDADALIDKAKKNWIWEKDEEDKTVPIIRYKDIVNAPTVEADVVRCKDCKYYEPDIEDCKITGCVPRTIHYGAKMDKVKEDE